MQLALSVQFYLFTRSLRLTKKSKARFKLNRDTCQYLARAVELLKVRELKEEADTIIPEAARDGTVTAGFLQSRLSEIKLELFNHLVSALRSDVTVLTCLVKFLSSAR